MPIPSNWQFILTDLHGSVLGEVTQGANRSVTLPLNGVPTASFTIPLWHTLAESVLGLDVLLKVYRRDALTNVNTLVFHGPLLSSEEVGDTNTQTIQATATGPFWRLTKRFLGQSKAGIQIGTDASPVDLGTIAQSLLTATNGGAGFTGISNGTTVASTNGVFGPVWLQNVAEAVATLATGINSFDYEVAPTEPTFPAGPFPQIGVLNCIPLIGTTKPNAVFEYGTTRANVTSYNRQRTLQDVVNSGIMSVQGWPDGTTQDLIIRTDPTSIATRGTYEDVLDDNGVLDDGLRVELISANLQYRANAREQITFTVQQNARPAPFIDYVVGDWIRARAVVNGNIRFDDMFRIWGITFQIDQNGNEALNLQLVQDST